ncbi:hypothetical protein EVG20_g5897 [Dentipellis fragilis]|uniref:Uncharacterized protein n=1 Tax=Dentipellis fragilis TaxID=205917 RepID=A0A4Y9YPV0_9AGAM|nr:hypothetical protein EVG20_g5897 [Dentipellis fragilis]
MLDFQHIPFDVWTLVFESAHPWPPGSLARCARTCRTFHDAATPYVYEEIAVRQYSGHAKVHTAFDTLAAQPHLRKSNEIIEVELSSARPPKNDNKQDSGMLAASWAADLALLPNLESYTLHAVVKHTVSCDFLEAAVNVLCQCAKLKHVGWQFEIDSRRFAIAGRLTNLQSMKILRLSQTVLKTFGTWVTQKSTINCIHIENTKGMDIEILPQVRETFLMKGLSRLNIGKGHSLTSDALLSLLERTPSLQELCIFYDNFAFAYGHVDLRPEFCGLPNLERLTVHHQGVGETSQYADLMAWISILAANSPLLSLSIRSDDGKQSRFVGRPILKLWPMLRELDIRCMELPYPSFAIVVEQCKYLKVLTFLLRPRHMKQYSDGLKADHNVEIISGSQDRRVRRSVTSYFNGIAKKQDALTKPVTVKLLILGR